MEKAGTVKEKIGVDLVGAHFKFKEFWQYIQFLRGYFTNY
jgi:hypothetical protein